MIYSQINADYLAARKAKDTAKISLLSTLIGEMQTVAKNIGIVELSDIEANKIIQKFVKNLKETLSLLNSERHSEEIQNCQTELAILEAYLPKQMSHDEIASYIQELRHAGMSTMKEFMAAFATLPADKKIVAELVKNHLTNI